MSEKSTVEDQKVAKESKIVKLNEESVAEKTLTPEQEVKLAKAKEDLENFTKEITDKKYVVGIKSKEDLENLISFISKDAKWKFTQCLGVIEVLKSLRKTNIKNESILLGALEIEAIYFFLSQHEGKGEVEANKIHSILKPINQAISVIREDAQKRDYLNSRVAAAEQGLDLDQINKR